MVAVFPEAKMDSIKKKMEQLSAETERALRKYEKWEAKVGGGGGGGGQGGWSLNDPLEKHHVSHATCHMKGQLSTGPTPSS